MRKSIEKESFELKDEKRIRFMNLQWPRGIECNFKPETLRIVTIAMICSNLAPPWKFNIFGSLYIAQSNINDGAFIAKIVSR